MSDLLLMGVKIRELRARIRQLETALDDALSVGGTLLAAVEVQTGKDHPAQRQRLDGIRAVLTHPTRVDG